MSITMRQKDLRPAPALIEYKGMKFLITDRPSDITINHYIMELKKNNVNTVVRVCEPSYNTVELEAQGINVKDLAFEDGTFPPQTVVDEWFEVLKDKYRQTPEACVAVHCVAGLGRAPVLVALGTDRIRLEI
ncbi:GL25773 [Drosophila persimilis]|uniref:Protein tyrosine phosphatase type IVA 3 n=1 Tax=Drosophila persimilis TaxID=7234 RepID=B4GK02_DROPE|nr:GL25773 [Drosophila persimilis]